MEESFVLTIDHNGKQLNLETLFMPVGYTHKFKVMVEGLEIFFEPDEEGYYRAVLPPGIDEKTRRGIDTELLQSIATTIKSELS